MPITLVARDDSRTNAKRRRRSLFARLATMWERHKAVERGEEPGHVLGALAVLDTCDDDELWARATRFFTRTE